MCMYINDHIIYIYIYIVIQKKMVINFQICFGYSVFVDVFL